MWRLPVADLPDLWNTSGEDRRFGYRLSSHRRQHAKCARGRVGDEPETIRLRWYQPHLAGLVRKIGNPPAALENDQELVALRVAGIRRFLQRQQFRLKVVAANE